MGSSIPKENMIPLGFDEEHDKIIRAKLKGSGSEKRKRAQRLRRLREMSDKQLEEKGLDIIKDSDKFDFEILVVIKELLERPLSDRTKVELLGKMVQTRQAVFGTKNANLNINVDMTETLWKRMQKEALKVIEGNVPKGELEDDTKS